jgi:hypothetical protein
MKNASFTVTLFLCGAALFNPFLAEAQKKAPIKRIKPKVAQKAPAPKATPKPANILSPEQKQAASSAIRQLRKLSSAVKVGLNNEKYSDRLIDVKAEVEDSLSTLKTGPIKTSIENSLRAYEDAKTVWDASAESNSAEMYASETELIFKRYGLVSPSAYEKNQNNGSMTLMFRVTYVDEVLNRIWGAAQKHLDKAEALNK